MAAASSTLPVMLLTVSRALAAGMIRVERGRDPVEGVIDAKTKAGRRSVPITATLRDVLVEHKLATGRDGDDLVFGTTATDPLVPCNQRRRALTAWKAAGLNPITPHECRHTFASIGIAAGLNAKVLSTFMGHASVSITLDRYGHLMPGSEDAAAGLLDTYPLRSAEGIGGAVRPPKDRNQPVPTGTPKATRSRTSSRLRRYDGESARCPGAFRIPLAVLTKAPRIAGR